MRYKLENGRKDTLLGLTEKNNSELDLMSRALGISRSAIVRQLVSGAYETFTTSRTLPVWTHKQLGVSYGD